MVHIRKIKQSEYRFLPEIEELADKTLQDVGVDVRHLLPTPCTYYESLNKEHSIIFVAEKGNKIIGFCYTTAVDHNGYLGELPVLPAYTRIGIGSKLLKKAIEWARAKHYTYIPLTTFAEIPFNAPMYEKFGFEEFVPDNNFPELKKIRKNEKVSGLEVKKRIAMKKIL
jgi:GNAT superfamily N-acetyltransferase